MSTPFMQLYVGDYLRDTNGLSTEGHGAYLLILMTMWNAGGWISADPKMLARYARVTPGRWAKISPDIMPLFIIEDDLCTQKRLLSELEKASGKSLKRSIAGKAGAEAKALKSKNAPRANAKANAIRLHKHSSETRNQKPERSSSEPKGSDGGAIAELFEPAQPSPKPEKPKPKAKPNGNDLKAMLYARGKEVFGQSSGGVITNLLKTYRDNAAKALAKIEDAAEHRDPLVWINAFLWQHGPPGIMVGRMSSAP